MPRSRLTALFCVIGLVLAAAPTFAHQEAGAHHHAASGIQADYSAEIDAIEKKLVGLAEAIPAEKYGWRPAEGVRSVSEVFMHVAAANYFFLGPLGMQGPEGLDPRSLEKERTGKDAVIAELKRSFEYARKGIAGVEEAQLDDVVSMFGRDWPKRRVLLLYVTHGHEHLGQMIAYARSSGVTPPWSE